mmetsp:Transcript_17997/g.58746  ORF Transcript_17997/g.58746 Transcript_17997/m.58746 type:complete len:247 (-) Transcript_17997:823-1563(-)
MDGTAVGIHPCVKKEAFWWGRHRRCVPAARRLLDRAEQRLPLRIGRPQHKPEKVERVDTLRHEHLVLFSRELELLLHAVVEVDALLPVAVPDEGCVLLRQPSHERLELRRPLQLVLVPPRLSEHVRLEQGCGVHRSLGLFREKRSVRPLALRRLHRRRSALELRSRMRERRFSRGSCLAFRRRRFPQSERFRPERLRLLSHRSRLLLKRELEVPALLPQLRLHVRLRLLRHPLPQPMLFLLPREHE